MKITHGGIKQEVDKGSVRRMDEVLREEGELG